MGGSHSTVGAPLRATYSTTTLPPTAGRPDCARRAWMDVDAEHIRPLALQQPRDELALIELPRGTAVVASPYPRPIPGVPVEQNLYGISFAVANATGLNARLMADVPELRSADAVIEMLRAHI